MVAHRQHRVSHQYHLNQRLDYHLHSHFAHQLNYQYQNHLQQALHLEPPYLHLYHQVNHLHHCRTSHQYRQHLKYRPISQYLTVHYPDLFHHLNYRLFGQNLAVKMHPNHRRQRPLSTHQQTQYHR